MAKKIDKKPFFCLFIVVVAFLIALGLIWYFSKSQPEPIKEIPQPETKILSPEEIQKALSKKAEFSTEIQPLTEKEINQALQKEIPKNKKQGPLTPEEIQEALNKKAE